MKMILGEGRIYFSSNNVCEARVNTNDEELLYPTEFLNSLKFVGIPNRDIRLKNKYSSYASQKSLNQEGLCNGTSLIVTHLENWSVNANIISVGLKPSKNNEHLPIGKPSWKPSL